MVADTPRIKCLIITRLNFGSTVSVGPPISKEKSLNFSDFSFDIPLIWGPKCVLNASERRDEVISGDVVISEAIYKRHRH